MPPRDTDKRIWLLNDKGDGEVPEEWVETVEQAEPPVDPARDHLPAVSVSFMGAVPEAVNELAEWFRINRPPGVFLEAYEYNDGQITYAMTVDLPEMDAALHGETTALTANLDPEEVDRVLDGPDDYDFVEDEAPDD